MIIFGLHVALATVCGLNQKANVCLCARVGYPRNALAEAMTRSIHMYMCTDAHALSLRRRLHLLRQMERLVETVQMYASMHAHNLYCLFHIL